MAKKLKRIKKKSGGRGVNGQVAVRHIGGGHKRFIREIDFKRTKKDVPGKVIMIEYDPNRSANLALIQYVDGDKSYILAPQALQVGDEILAGPKASLKPGHHLPLKKIPLGMPIHNLELSCGKGGQIVRSAGVAATILAKDRKFAVIKLPSGEERKVAVNCFATLGQVGNMEHRTRKIGSAGRKRRMGIRPTVRGVAQHPAAHPHGGGEGRSGIGMSSPKSPWSKKTLGKRTRKKKKYSDKYIIKRRK